MGRCPGGEPSTLTRCHSYMNSLKGGSLSVAKPTTLGHKRDIFFFIFLALLIYFRSFHGMMHANPAVVGESDVY